MRFAVGALGAALLFPATATAQSIPLPAFGSTFTGTLTRGYWFVAPVDCVITQVSVPNESQRPFQVVEILDLGSTPPFFPGTVTGTQLFYDNTSAGGSNIATSIVLAPGQVIGVLGACNDAQGSATSHSSYGSPPGPFQSSILGNPVTLTRLGTQSGIASNGGNQPCWQEPAAEIARVRLTIVPATGLYASFTASVRSGPTPLAVNFQDTSYSGAPGGVTSWAWDFENDGTIDSTLQNPSHTYTACGTYDVSLRVFDSVNPPSTATELAFIATDRVTAGFNHQAIGPLTVQFTDASSGPATSWAWDLDGDGTTDSTVPNPTWAYANFNPVAVTLTVARLCTAPDTITRTIVPAQCLATTLAGGNGGGPGWTMLFDCDVTNPRGITIAGLGVGLSSTGIAHTVEVWVGSDTYVGNEMNPDHWQLAATGTGTSQGPSVATPLALDRPIYFPPGDYAIAMHYSGGMPYTNGGATNIYGNSDLTLDLGISRSTALGAPFGAGTAFTPRVWNGHICYTTFQLAGEAGYGFAGSGCAGSQGVTSSLVANATPMLGTTMSVRITDMPDLGGGMTAALLSTGFSNTTAAFGPLPLHLGPVGAPGCTLRVSPDFNAVLLGSNHTATWSLTIPNDPGLGGVLFFQQATVLDPGFNAIGAVGSHAGGLLIGN